MVGQEAHFYPEHCLLYNCIEHYLTLDYNPIVNNCVKYTVLLFATLMFQHQIGRYSMCTTYCLFLWRWRRREDTTCRYSMVGATDFCLCTSRGFEGKRFLTVKSNSKVENQSNSRASLQYWIVNNYGESIMDTRLEAQMKSSEMIWDSPVCL